MKSILLSIRDFHFVGHVRKGYPEEKAYKEARQSVIACFIFWYVALLISVVMIGYELDIHLIPNIERSFINNLSVGLLAMAPYVITMWQVTRKLNYIPVYTTASYKRLAWTAISVVIGGIIMMILFPFLLHEVVFD